MINYKYADLFKTDNVDKQFIITTDDGAVTITNIELHQEQFELSESICSDSTLRFGACEASSVKFRMSNVFSPLKGKWLTVKCVLNGHDDEPFVFGRYKVDSDKPTADKRYRDVVAYDVMYDILTADVAEWYNSLTFPMPLKTFRNAFISYFNLEEVEISLPNDEMTVERTIEPSEISGRDVITAICEINGCFGHINPNGMFNYIILQEQTEALYPANDLFPANNLFPRTETGTTLIKKSKYISCQYEDYVTKQITSLIIRQEENDIGVQIYADNSVIVASEDLYVSDSLYVGQSINGNYNAYIVQDNFLVYGKGTEELTEIAERLFAVIKYVTYRPATVKAIGNPCLSVGDGIKLFTKYQIVKSYILSRTLKGIQGLKDNYTAKGAEEQTSNVNSVQKSIIQLKGKTNVLVRTIEETRSTITDVERGLKTEILQTAEQIKQDASATYTTKTETSDAISTVTSELNSTIDQRANSILVSVNEDITETKTYIDGQVETLNTELSASIQLNSNAITSEVSRAQNAETQLSTRLTQTESGFNAQIQSIDGRVTEINANLESVSSQISGYDGRFNKIEQTIEGVTFEDEDGVTKISGDTITTGTIRGVALLFVLRNRIYWACGTTDLTNADTEGEWVCDSNALYAHDDSGNRSIELDRDNGNGIFYGDVIVRGTRSISVINTYDLAVEAKALADSNAQKIENLDTGDLGNKISGIESDISLIFGDLSNLEDLVSTNSTNIGVIIETITSLDSRITDNAGDISAHNRLITDLQNRMIAVENKLGID